MCSHTLSLCMCVIDKWSENESYSGYHKKADGSSFPMSRNTYLLQVKVHYTTQEQCQTANLHFAASLRYYVVYIATSAAVANCM